MYVYIKDNKIQEVTPHKIDKRDGYTELDIKDEDIELTNNFQYLVYEKGTVVRKEHTEEEFNKLSQEHRADPKHYGIRRRLEYPALEEQLDYIYHKGVDAWKADIIDPIKKKYPKGGS